MTICSTSATGQSDRVQIFKPDGTFIKEVFFAKNTLASGSTWEIAFSRDPERRFIYLTDGQNEVVAVTAGTQESIIFFRGK